jgi:hypothetical protein
LQEAGFRLFLRCPRLPQEQDTPEAMDFRFPQAFLMLLYQGMGLSQCLCEQDSEERFQGLMALPLRREREGRIAVVRQ